LELLEPLKMAWENDRVRHQLSAEHIHVVKLPRTVMRTVYGLDELIHSYLTKANQPVDRSEVTKTDIKFDYDDFFYVLDTAGLLYDGQTQAAKKEALDRAPLFILGKDKHALAYGSEPLYHAFVGTGGKFIRNQTTGIKYIDNKFIEPDGYVGDSIVFPQPERFIATGRELGKKGQMYTFDVYIGSLVGLEKDKARMPARQLAAVA
jgi:hypothetical protein